MPILVYTRMDEITYNLYDDSWDVVFSLTQLGVSCSVRCLNDVTAPKTSTARFRKAYSSGFSIISV